MLRFLFTVSLCLLIIFTGIGLFISRAWGWSEYTSPELYVIYYQLKRNIPQYFIVNADGSGQPESLAAVGERILKLDCSPDGRKLAYLTDLYRVSVVNSAGTIYNQLLDPAYMIMDLSQPRTDIFNVNNLGSVALFQGSIGFLVNAAAVQILRPPYVDVNDDYYHVEISSQGWELWSSRSHGIEVFASDGQLAATFPHANLGKWLASEQVFTFTYDEYDASDYSLMLGRHLLDTRTKTAAYAGSEILSMPFSPAGTRTAISMVPNNDSHDQVILDNFSDHEAGSIRQLTNASTSSNVLCFLAFRPQTLIAES